MLSHFPSVRVGWVARTDGASVVTDPRGAGRDQVGGSAETGPRFWPIQRACDVERMTTTVHRPCPFSSKPRTLSCARAQRALEIKEEQIAKAKHRLEAEAKRQAKVEKAAARRKAGPSGVKSNTIFVAIAVCVCIWYPGD